MDTYRPSIIGCVLLTAYFTLGIAGMAHFGDYVRNHGPTPQDHVGLSIFLWLSAIMFLPILFIAVGAYATITFMRYYIPSGAKKIGLTPEETIKLTGTKDEC